MGLPVSFDSWKAIARSRVILAILLVTVLAGAGQFLLFTYIKPLLTALTGAPMVRITLDLTVLGVMSIVGNILASRIVSRFGVFRTCVLSLLAILMGMLLAAGATSHVAVTAGLVAWGLGFASSHSMQQARLAAEAPSLTAASIALNTSAIYIGQAIGASLGGVMVPHGQLTGISAAAAVFIALAVAMAIVSERLRPARLLGRPCPMAADCSKEKPCN